MTQGGFARIVRLAAHLPAIERSTWYGTDSLKAQGKTFLRLKEKMEGVAVVMVPVGLKEALIDAEPEKYFETTHYTGYPAMLVRLDAIDDDELRNRIECAWMEKPPKRLRAQYEETAR